MDAHSHLLTRGLSFFVGARWYLISELARLILLGLGQLLFQVADPALNRLVTAWLLQANIFADRALGRLLLKVDVGNPDHRRSALLGLLKGLHHVHLILLLLLLCLCRSEVHALPRTTRVLLLDNLDPLLFLCWDLLPIEPFEVRDSLQDGGAVLRFAAQWR